jgi:hypothetical protein
LEFSGNIGRMGALLEEPVGSVPGGSRKRGSGEIAQGMGE